MNSKAGGAKKKTRNIEWEILKALDEFTVGLESGDVFNHINRSENPQALNDSVLVRETRKRLRLRHAAFARLLGVSTAKIKEWELGEEAPHPTAKRFMEEISLNPEYWIQRSHDIGLTKKNGKPSPA